MSFLKYLFFYKIVFVQKKSAATSKCLMVVQQLYFTETGLIKIIIFANLIRKVPYKVVAFSIAGGSESRSGVYVTVKR